VANKAAPRATRNDRLLTFLQRTGMRKGVMGTSRGWLYVFVGTFALRRLRRAIGSEPEVVYRGELKPGQAFTIDHLPETYSGRRVRVRRK
jgi:hypothetical protein